MALLPIYIFYAIGEHTSTLPHWFSPSKLIYILHNIITTPYLKGISFSIYINSYFLLSYTFFFVWSWMDTYINYLEIHKQDWNIKRNFLWLETPSGTITFSDKLSVLYIRKIMGIFSCSDLYFILQFLAHLLFHRCKFVERIKFRHNAIPAPLYYATIALLCPISSWLTKSSLCKKGIHKF